MRLRLGWRPVLPVSAQGPRWLFPDTAPTRRRLAELLAGHSTPTSPFQHPVPSAGRWGQSRGPELAAVYVRPELAVRVRYLGWEAGRLRHAAYRGVA